jgi:hypothetical protein
MSMPLSIRQRLNHYHCCYYFHRSGINVNDTDSRYHLLLLLAMLALFGS